MTAAAQDGGRAAGKTIERIDLPGGYHFRRAHGHSGVMPLHAPNGSRLADEWGGNLVHAQISQAVFLSTVCTAICAAAAPADEMARLRSDLAAAVRDRDAMASRYAAEASARIAQRDRAIAAEADAARVRGAAQAVLSGSMVKDALDRGAVGTDAFAQVGVGLDKLRALAAALAGDLAAGRSGATLSEMETVGAPTRDAPVSRPGRLASDDARAEATRLPGQPSQGFGHQSRGDDGAIADRGQSKSDVGPTHAENASVADLAARDAGARREAPPDVPLRHPITGDTWTLDGQTARTKGVERAPASHGGDDDPA